MKVVTAAETIELGVTEIRPTIEITDFSRRVTDDFGVTTVVPRGFSRRMSVRFAMPTVDVDRVQRRLANLRATKARWTADESLAWLDFEGFYKDLNIDLPGPALSYCTLTIEGLAETEAVADPGGDPAPGARASTLLLLHPVDVTDAELTSSNVPEYDHSEWSPGISYAMGDKVIRAGTHRIYESAADGNQGNSPEGDSGLWIDIGPTNRWAMFDQALGTATSLNDGITVVLAAPAIRAVALLDVVGSTVRVQGPGYDRTQAVGDGAILFGDLPGGPGDVTVTIAGAGSVAVGTLLIGKLAALGDTGADASAGINDFSRKERDDFGEWTIVPRSWSKTMSVKALIRTDAVDLVANRIAAARARPSLWIGAENLDCLTIYGFFRGFSIEAGANVSVLSLDVEGLSEAAPIGGGLPPVSWPDVVDSDPVNRPKPEDGATVGGTIGENVKDSGGNVVPPEDLLTSLGISADTVKVAGVDGNDLLNAISTAQDEIDGLIETYGETAAASAAAQEARDARDVALGAATVAGGHASTASTKRDEASGFASAAQGSAVVAKLAASTVGLTQNAQFSEGLAGWVDGYARDADDFYPSAYVPAEAWNGAAHVALNDSGRKDMRGTVVAIDPTRTYRLRARYRNENAVAEVYAGLGLFDATGAFQTSQWPYGANPAATGAWVEVDTPIDTGGLAGFAGFAPFVISTAGPCGFDYCYIDDVTESKAAEIAASVANSSAAAAGASESSAAASAALSAGYRDQAEGHKNAAQAQAGIAADQAAIATAGGAAATDSKNLAATYRDQSQGYRNEAEGFKNAASTQAGISTSQAAIAEAARAAAQQSAILSASVGSGSLNKNPVFASWDVTVPDYARPTGWYFNSHNDPTVTYNRVAAGSNSSSPWALQMWQPNGTTFNSIIAERVRGTAGGWYVVTLEAAAGSGSWQGSGVFVLPLDSGGSSLPWSKLDCYTDKTSDGLSIQGGSANYGRKTWTKLVQMPALTEYIDLYLCAAYSFNVFGYTGATNPTKWFNVYNCSIRPATPAEIRDQTVLAPMEATVATQGSVLATHDQRLASWLTRASAGAGFAELALSAFDSNGQAASRIGMTADWISFGSVNQRTVEVVDGIVRVNGNLYLYDGLLIADSGTHMTVIGKGFGVGNNLVRWFGPTMAPHLCSEANAISCETMQGQAYYAGAFATGSFRSNGGTSNLSPTAEAMLGPIGTNGNPISVAVSWIYRSTMTINYPATTVGQNRFDADCASYGAMHQGGYYYSGSNTGTRPSSTLQLERKIGAGALGYVTQSSSTVENRSFSGHRPSNTSGDPGDATTATLIRSAATSFTYVDTAGLGDRTYRAAITRGFNYGEGSVSQTISIVTQE